MRKIALAIICGMLMAFPAGAQSAGKKAFAGIDMTCQQWEDGDILKNCKVAIDKGDTATIEELRFSGMTDDRIDFLGFYGLKTPSTRIGTIEYENVTGSPGGILAMLTAGGNLPDLFESDQWKDMKAEKIRFMEALVSDDGMDIFIRNGSIANATPFASGPAELAGIEFRENGGTIASIDRMSLRSASLAALEGLLADDRELSELAKDEVALLSGANIRDLVLQGVKSEEAGISIGKIVFDYDGGAGKSKGSLRIENAEFPGKILAPLGLSGLPEKISASLSNNFDVTRKDGGISLDQDTRASIPGLLDFAARAKLSAGKGGFDMPSLLLSIEDKGLVAAIPLPAKMLVKTFINGYVPGIQDTLDKFLSRPGQKFTLSRLKNEKDGVTVEVSETGPEDWI